MRTNQKRRGHSGQPEDVRQPPNVNQSVQDFLEIGGWNFPSDGHSLITPLNGYRQDTVSTHPVEQWLARVCPIAIEGY